MCGQGKGTNRDRERDLMALLTSREDQRSCRRIEFLKSLPLLLAPQRQGFSRVGFGGLWLLAAL